jgi:hypothetical protein
MSINSFAAVTGTLDLQNMRQMQADNRTAESIVATASSDAAAIQYVQPAPPPPPRPGPAPARLPDISTVPDETASGAASIGSPAQRLTAVRSILLTLPPASAMVMMAPLPNLPSTGAVPVRTLLTI